MHLDLEKLNNLLKDRRVTSVKYRCLLLIILTRPETEILINIISTVFYY